MNKQKVVLAIIEKLRGDLALYHKAAGAARAEATHEQSRAEHKYDTRGLEASYLARGQSRHASEIDAAIAAFEKLPLREFGPEDSIDVGAMIELKEGREKTVYFLGPRAGGTEVDFDDTEITVITPESPLGSQLMGQKRGNKCVLGEGNHQRTLIVARVW